MPSRRRPSEPSARVRALLESTDRRAVALDAGRPVGEVLPWLPERSWVETPAAASRVRSPHPTRRKLLSRGSGGDWRYGEFAPAAVEPPRAAHGADRSGRPAHPSRPGRHRRPVPPGPRFLTIPASLRGARLSGPRAAAAGLLLVVLVAAVAFGVRVAWAKAASTPQVVAPAASGSALGDQHASGSVFASSSTASGGGGPPAVGTVTVHVVGQVKRPGVFTMPAGSRVADVVAKAGVRKGADLAAINLARPLVDGEQIHVPRPGEVLAGAAGGGAGAGSGPAGSGAGGAGASGSGGAGAGAGAAGSASGVAGRVNLNTASAAELEELPGVGPVLAQRIIDWRTEHGRFASVDELGEVSGIGEKIFAALQPKVTV